MHCRLPGRTGLQVPEFVLGTIPFGSTDGMTRHGDLTKYRRDWRPIRD